MALAPFVPFEKLFAAEPRHADWAEAVEPAILSYDKKVAEAVLPGFVLTSVECRTTMCRLKWTAPETTASLVSDVIHHLIPGALMMSRRNGEYYVAFAGSSPLYKDIEVGDSAATIAALTKDRQRRANTIIHRGGRGLNLSPEILAAWPKGDAP